MQNKLMDLNNYLFEQIERLNDEDLSEDEFRKEIKKANAMVGISSQIISNAKIELAAAKLALDYGVENKQLPPMINYDENQR